MKASKKTGTKAPRQSTGIQSIEVGAPLLSALGESDIPMSLTALAAAANMPLSQAHKYLASFMRVGLVVQFGRTGLYDVGPLALHLGLTALRRLNVFETAQQTIHDLRDELRTTVSLTVWGSQGPTVVRTAGYVQAVGVSIALGTVLPILTSANGQIFGAFLDIEPVRTLMAVEMQRDRALLLRMGLPSRSDIDALLRNVRAQRLAINDGRLHPGLSALSTPVFDNGNSLVAALTLVSVPGTMDLSRNGVPAETLVAKAQELSARLGAKAKAQS